MSWRSSCAASAAIACGLCAPALGSPRSDPTVGRAVFTGATSSNATSIDVNPAALGLGQRSELYMAALAVLDHYSIDLHSVDLDSGALTPGPPGFTDTTISPGGTLALVWHTGTDSRITLGLELPHVPPGERFLEENAVRYHTLGGYHRVIAVGTVAASIRVTRRFYVGVSIAAQNNYLKLRFSRDTALDAGRDPDRGIASDCGGAPCGIENPLAAENYEVEVSSGWSASILAANLGALVRIAKDTWVGVGYHVPPGLEIQNALTGSMSVTRAPRDGGDVVRGSSTVYISQPASVDVELRSRVFEQLDLHVGGRWEDLSRFQSYDVRGYGSSLPPNNIPEWQPRPRGFHDSFALWAGVEQAEQHSATPLLLGARVGVETSALDDSKTTPLTIAPASATLDLGVHYRVSPNMVVQFTYGLQYFPALDVSDSAFDPRDRIACYDSGFDYSTPGCASVRNGYATATAAGDYQRIEQAMRLAVRVEL